MKVYFEECGSGDGQIFINVYVNPQEDGSGYQYDLTGKRHKFWWADPDEARVFDHTELPKDLLFSIRHGLDEVAVDEDKFENWTFNDLIYKKVDRESVRAYNEFQKMKQNIKTVEDFKNAYPTIKKCGFITDDIMKTLFRVMNIPSTPVQNGEIGIAFMMDRMNYSEALYMLGIEEKPIVY